MIRPSHKAQLLALLATLLISTGGATLASLAQSTSAAFDPAEALPGGDTTIPDDGVNAFSMPAANLSVDRQTPFFIGNSFFKKNWVESPASTTGRDGLGPHFITRSCAGCHALDGRGAPPKTRNGQSIEQPVGLLLRLSIPGDGGKDGIVAEPTYGGQLDNFAVTGVRPEAKVSIRYKEVRGRFADGTPYSLRAPTYRITQPAYGPLHPQVQVSPRVGPQVIGLGLLEAIREEDILANATRQEAEAQGISGRPNRVWDTPSQQWMLGRFGWKANVATIAHQTAAAFNGDIGITSSLFHNEECMPSQADCIARQRQEAEWRAKSKAREASPHDIDDRTLANVVFYTRTLAVPARRNPQDATVLRGKGLFNDAGCASCHTPKYVTGDLAGLPELSKQTIFPYTDLLLHDMGEGLADGRPDFQADGREWRTPPLWGLGLVPTVNSHSFFLHDGRARNLMEAVLWHGGEAEASKQKVLKFDKAERAALIKFLESL
ncbi:di-heme oxidoreductase family protein [Uliginosibacterium sp. H1]|uniref:di-heme oxidoreductase family protein n=1 Tax=Uliginosibacterium sp. H1 TaxID=3114757 RepID=UPI002E193E83|nr:di-heme oxidoredictase family protein [Uliginosibacterium sp. H1]